MAIPFLYERRAQYGSLLSRTIEEAEKGSTQYQQLSCMALPDRARIATTVFTRKLQQRMDLVYPQTESTDDSPEEVILAVQGYAVHADLPPVLNSHRIPKNILSAKQSIKLTGLGVEAFDACAAAILEVQQVFSTRLPPNAMQKWTPTMEHGCLVLEVSNRYFSDRDIADDDLHLSDCIDPLHLLRNRMPSNARHSKDNEVLYFERRKSESTFQYTTIDPTGVQLGNLVEVQLAFCAVPIGKGRYKFLLKLRSICVLNRIVERDLNQSVLDRLRSSKHSPVKKVKRRAGYDLDSTEDTRLHMKRLRLDNIAQGGVKEPLRDMDME